MTGIIYAVIASILFSILFVILKKSYEEFSPEITYFFYMLIGILVWVPFSLLYGFDFQEIMRVFPYAILSAILSEALSFYVLSKGEVSITGTILASYPVYTVILSGLFLHEKMSTVVLGFVILTIVGTILASLPDTIVVSEFKKKSYILWGIIGALAVGVSDTTSKSIIDQTSASEFLFSLAFAQISVSLLYLYFTKAKIPSLQTIVTKMVSYKFLLWSVSINAVAIVFLWLAFENTLASIASPISASFPGLMILLAAIFLHERPKKMELVGLGCVLIGILGVSYFAG